MPQTKSKKILLYFFLFLLIGTINNKNLNNLELTKIENVTVSGLDDKNNYELINNLDFLKIESLFFLDKKKIIQTINSNNLIEKYSVFKKYPSEIEIKVDQTNFLAQLKKGNENFLFGSNGKFIKTASSKSNIPFIFGNFDKENFFKLKKAIDETDFSYEEIKNLFFFPSGRWDIETNSGLLIKLPRNNFKKSLDLLVGFLNSTREEEINKIDLRQLNQIITNG
jgi:cell division protein FtsQ